MSNLQKNIHPTSMQRQGKGLEYDRTALLTSSSFLIWEGTRGACSNSKLDYIFLIVVSHHNFKLENISPVFELRCQCRRNPCGTGGGGSHDLPACLSHGHWAPCCAGPGHMKASQLKENGGCEGFQEGTGGRLRQETLFFHKAYSSHYPIIN